ncbi:hypothetical protein HYY75_01325 [bacterium]|nr:hypothetical protein [bacterium]
MSGKIYFSHSLALGTYQLLFNCLGFAAAGLVPWLVGHEERVKEGFQNYLGFLPKPKSKPVIWVHGVSLGESFVACAVMERIRQLGSSICLGFTTTHPDVLASIRKKKIADILGYFPLDSFPIMFRAFSRWNPKLVIVTETDFWPMFAFLCRQRRIPLILINGRISEKLRRFYLAIPKLGEVLFGSFDLLCVQTLLDKEKLTMMGAFPDRIKVLGNIKADVVSRSSLSNNEIFISWKKESRVIAFGSLHPMEFLLLKPILSSILKIANIKLLIAPRNIKDSIPWESDLTSAGFNAGLRSKISISANSPSILILDTFGELASLYGLSAVAFIGGSLDPKVGGHNPIEALQHDVPVIVGPHTRNFEDLLAELVQENGVSVVSNVDEFEKALRNLLFDASFAADQIKASGLVLARHKGALNRTIEEMTPYLEKTRKEK